MATSLGFALSDQHPNSYLRFDSFDLPILYHLYIQFPSFAYSAHIPSVPRKFSIVLSFAESDPTQFRIFLPCNYLSSAQTLYSRSLIACFTGEIRGEQAREGHRYHHGSKRCSSTTRLLREPFPASPDLPRPTSQQPFLAIAPFPHP